MLLEHNKKVFARMEELLTTEGSCCVVMGTGVGKSYIIKELLEKNKFHALVVSPRQSINRSWEKLCGKKVETVTYQKLANIYKEIDYSFYDIVVCDEVHHIGAPKWGKPIKYLIDNKITMVVGLTESSVRYSDGARDVALEFFKGNVAFGVDVPTAIKNKILNPVTYVGAMYNSDGLKKTLRGKIQSRLYAKLNLILNKTPTVEEIIKKNMPEGNRKGIIFASTIDDIKFAIDFMHNIYPDAKIRVVHSKLPKSAIEKNMNWFKRVKSGYLCSVDMISEGVHIKGVNTLIMLRRTESVNLFNQQLGRCLSASCKEPAILFDLVNNQYSVHVTQNRVHIRTNSIKNSGKINVVASDQLIIKDYQKNIVDVLEEIKKSLDVSWTEEEIQKLKDFMSSGKKGIRKFIKENFPNRTYSAAWNKMSELGLACHNHYWTDEEIAVLTEWYHLGIELAAQKIKEICGSELSPVQVCDKANRLNLHLDKSWSEQEMKILFENYPKMGLSVCKLLPGRTGKQCKQKANQYNLKVEYEPNNPWTEEENDLLKKYYPLCGYKVPGLNRNKTAIQRRARLLKLKYVGGNKIVRCVETNTIYESAIAAAKTFDGNYEIVANKIRNCCNGNRKTAYGFHWEYVE